MDERSRKENGSEQVLSVPRTIDESGAGGRLRVYSRVVPGLALGVVTGDSRVIANLPAEDVHTQALTFESWADFLFEFFFPLLRIRGEMTSAHDILLEKRPPSLVINHFSQTTSRKKLCPRPFF